VTTTSNQFRFSLTYLSISIAADLGLRHDHTKRSSIDVLK